MTIRQMKRLIGLVNLLLLCGIISVGVWISMAPVPDFQAPSEAPLPPAAPTGLYPDRPQVFQKQYEACWEVLVVEAPPSPTCTKCGNVLPDSGRCSCKEVVEKILIFIRVSQLNGASLPALGSAVFEYQGTSPGNTERPSGSSGYTQQKHLQFVGSAKPFRLSTGYIVRMIEVVTKGEDIGVRFEILEEDEGGELKRKFTVKFSPRIHPR